MKKIKRMLIALAALVLCIVPILSTPITAQAAEPVTYWLRYVPEKGEWRFQTGGWVENGYHRELYYMHQDIKDGDLVVIDSTDQLELTINANLKNLTVKQSDYAVITVKSVDEFYAINGSTCAITGDINKADIYDKCVVNLNSNVKELNVLSEKKDTLSSTVAVLGTVDHLYAGGANYKHYEFYNFAANSLRIEKGALKTDASKYSTAPVAATPEPAPVAPVAPAPAPVTPSDELDAVPKTADIRFNPLWLIGLAAVGFVGSYCLMTKKEN